MEPTERIGTGIPHKDASCVLHLAKELQHLPLRGGSFFLHCLPEHADSEARTRSTHLCAEATKKKERKKEGFRPGPKFQEWFECTYSSGSEENSCI